MVEGHSQNQYSCWGNPARRTTPVKRLYFRGGLAVDYMAVDWLSNQLTYTLSLLQSPNINKTCIMLSE